jgi:hypothetical protein
MQKQRRDFLKMTAAGTVGLALIRADKAHAAWPSTGSLAVNPNISNMRVVSCVDTLMMKSTPTTMSFAAENAAVDACRVQANMDAMAMQLANTTTPDAAWKAIFRSSKAWASTIVAIKVNTIEPKNMGRIAVVQKFCSVLAGFGVPPANIIIYDGNTTYGAGISNYTTYFSLTDTTKIQAVVSGANSAALGSTMSAPLPDGTSATCTKWIADGTVDILINIANNKGHSMFGGSTLSMKNHFGTFAPNHTNLANYVLTINKSDAILGGDPVRQQLCFIDSLIANKASNTGTPEVMPCYLVMGVLGPAVDYLTVKKVREEVMGCTHDAPTVNSFLTSFGYTTADPVWVVVPPATAGCGSDAGTSGTGGANGSGGNSGTRDAGRDGTSGTGGASSGGVNGSGGAGTGGVKGAGGAGSGGVNASGSAGSGGIRGTGGGGSGTGGTGSGGVIGTGGAGSGGTVTMGGSTGSGGTSSNHSGVGGNGGSTTSAAGGAMGTGGTSAASVPGASSGCGCDLGGIPGGGGRLGLVLASGALVAGMLQRLAVRKESRAQDADPPSESDASKADRTRDEKDGPLP